VSISGNDLDLILFSDRSVEQEIGVDMVYPGWRGGYSVVYKRPDIPPTLRPK
jgi:hypothetical protein